MSSPLLDLDGHLVGRTRELADMDRVLDAAGRDGGQYVLLSGPAGVGKSTLVRAFGEDIGRREGVFAYGRHQEGARAPYSAVGEAFDELVKSMDAAPPGERARWREDLDRGLRAMAGAARELVPGLAGGQLPATEISAAEAPDRRHLLRRAATRLATIAASYRPVVLAIDDLQWADQDSVTLLSDLLMAEIRNVTVVGVVRTGVVDPSSMSLPEAGRHAIELEPLTRAEVESLLAAVCGPVTGLEGVATEFHHRTGGNPLHVRQLLRQAQREGALAHADGRAVWNLRALTAIEITGDVATLLGRSIDQLPGDDAAVVSAVACIGREFDLADAVRATAMPPETVGRALWSALDLRLLEAVDMNGRRIAPVIDHVTRYRFSHDRVAEAARRHLHADAQRDVHLRIGRALAGEGPSRLFDAARHLAIGGSAPRAVADRARFAEVQLLAARTARLRASYPLALDSFRAGLALLGGRRWTEHPELARELQLGAAEAAYLVSDGSLLDQLLDEAEPHLDDPADRAHLAYLRLRGQIAGRRLQEAIETGLRALDALGEAIPHRAGKPQAIVALLVLRRMLRRWSDEQLQNLPRCADPGIVEAQLILGEMRNLSYIVRPELFPLVVRKELELTLRHGHVPSTPVAVVSYAVLLVVAGDHRGAQRFGELALVLADRPRFRGARPETLFLHLNFVRHWRHPMRESLTQLRDAYQEALDRGDPEHAGLVAAVLLYQSVFVGRPLAEVDALAQSIIPEIRSQLVPAALCRSMQQLCLNMMGRSSDPFLLAGESGYDEREVLPVAREENDVVAVGTAAIIKLGLRFWCGDHEGGLPLAEETARYLDGLVGTPNVQLYHLVNALSRIRVAPRDRATARAVRRALTLHRTWAAEAPGNYAAPDALIRGVWLRAEGDLRTAERHLDRAIVLAEEHRLPLIGALAHEEAGALYAQTGRAFLIRIMIRAAHERWVSLDMAVRSNRLEREHPWLLGRDLVKPGSGTVDPAGIRHVVQMLAAAATPAELAEVLLSAVADTTGAARVLLLAAEGEDLTLRAVRRSGTTTMAGPGVAEVHGAAAVRESARSGRPQVVAGAGAPGLATLIVPIRLRGRTIGAVCADLDADPEADPDPARAFGPGQEDAVVALCSAAAALFWNVELEGRLHQADEHRQSLMEVQSRFIPGELLRILDIDDIRLVRRGHRVERDVTVLISDIRGYSSLVEGLGVAEASDVALGFLRAVEVPIITNNGLLQDVRGDEVLAVFDAAPDDAVSAGLAMLRSLGVYNRERAERGADELRVGIGVTTGPVALGLVGGVNRMALTVIGDAVNLASRIESTTKRYGSSLLIGDDTRDRLVSPERFDIRRMERVSVVNRRRPVTIYEVYTEDPPDLRDAKRAAQPVFDTAFALFDAGDARKARTAFEHCRDLLPLDQVATLHLAHCDALARGELMPGREVPLKQK
jgi:predicted ATPase/class 3 adenylate cyclase